MKQSIQDGLRTFLDQTFQALARSLDHDELHNMEP